VLVFNKQDWEDWVLKLKWQLISFKFLSFSVVLYLLVKAWGILHKVYMENVALVESLYEKQVLSKSGASEVLMHTQTVLYDSALSHMLTAVTTILTAIIAIKGVSYFTHSRQLTEVVKKLGNGHVEKNISKFLPRMHKK